MYTITVRGQKQEAGKKFSQKPSAMSIAKPKLSQLALCPASWPMLKPTDCGQLPNNAIRSIRGSLRRARR
jgi:hypothetical protein